MIGWIDGSAGASGDMLLGALVDAGVPLELLQGTLDRLDVGLELESSNVRRGGIRGLKIDVAAPADDREHRGLHDVRALLDRLDSPLRAVADGVFTRLAEAEAAIHGVDVDAVHFHEVGALDAIADVVCVVAGFLHLRLDELHASPLALGSGTVEASHGTLPVPAPATLKLVEGVPVQSGDVPHEMTTPTGAALVTTLATSWGSLPPMAVQRTGHGAGSRDLESRPNVLRLVLGTPIAADAGNALQLEANIDDMDPRLWPSVMARILDAGASDAWLTPIQMKKGRPAFTLSVLTHAARAPAVRTAIFAETTTIGLREFTASKVILDRAIDTIEVDGQPIRIKRASRDGTALNVSVEWEDVAAAAAATGTPVKQMLARATAAAHRTTTDRA